MDKFNNSIFPPIFEPLDNFDLETEQKLQKAITVKLDEAIDILDYFSKNGMEEYERARNKLYALKIEIDKDDEINFGNEPQRQELFEDLEDLLKLFVKGVLMSKNTIYTRGYIVVLDVKSDILKMRF